MVELLIKYGSIVCAIISLIALVYSIYTNVLYRRLVAEKNSIASNYYNTLQHLKSAFELIHQQRRNVSFDDAEFMKVLVEFSNICKQAFDEITNSECHVAIKIFSQENNETIIHTLARDSGSFNKSDIQFKARLRDDTAALSVFSGNKYFLNNDLQKGIKATRDLAYNKENSDWQLPYQALLIVPIKEFKQDNQGAVYGLFAVESKKSNAFDKSTDLGIADAIADGLADIIMIYLKGASNNTKR